jgi:hypothetical protein
MIFLLIADTASRAFVLAPSPYCLVCVLALSRPDLGGDAYAHAVDERTGENWPTPSFSRSDGPPDSPFHSFGCTTGLRRLCFSPPAACSTPPGRCPTTVADPIRHPPSSATTRSSTPTSAPRPSASMWRSRSTSPDRVEAMHAAASEPHAARTLAPFEDLAMLGMDIDRLRVPEPTATEKLCGFARGTARAGRYADPSEEPA